jgi:hypothetical protein
LASSTTAGLGVAWGPKSSSAEITITMVSITDAHMIAGIRIQSLPFANAHTAQA